MTLRLLTNCSNSTYNSLQLEGRSRNYHGLTMHTSLNQGQLNDLMTFRMTGSGPFISAASAVGTDGRAAVAGAGTIGTLQQRVFSGPWDTNFDFGMSKTTKIRERYNVTLRMDASNFFNHPAFSVGDQTVTSTTFGKITGPFNSSRRIQFTLQVRF